ncbi:MAG: T9SS type A sorting domain-containing protein [Lewinellaceae bacterium]|nr:T9SS type A sorting domain-containing protein [Lewinellaceae bacterium]
MNTNIILRLLCYLGVFTLPAFHSIAQVSVFQTSCSGLQAKLEAFTTSNSNDELSSYTLEVLKDEGLWVSSAKNHTFLAVSEFENLQKGIYRVKVVVADADNRNLLISDPIAINGCPFAPGNATNEIAISLRPNPASTKLEIQILSGLISSDLPATLDIIDGLGHTVESMKLISANTTISVAHLPAGIYFISIKNNSNLSAFEKLVIKK